jgi:DNA adenine methylase
LRYPGGKSAIAGFLAETIRETGSKTYVEPYAGGAGAAISLLLNNVVDEIVINDYDKAVYSFWKEVTIHSKRFIEKLNSVPFTIEEWVREREIYRNPKNHSQEELGFAFFYLNRTNRSGIVKAGVIGGIGQSGEYRLDARFNRKALEDKIKDIAQHRNAITIYNKDGAEVFEEFSNNENAFIYLDPPYVQQGKNLYLNAFQESHHKELGKKLLANKTANWLLTYDEDQLIKDIYRRGKQYLYSINYSAQNKRKASELLICSNKLAKYIDRYKN